MPEATANAARPVYDSARSPHPFVEEILELWAFRDLVALWAARTVKLRYKRSVLGVLWTLIEPLMLLIILSIVFTALFRFQLEHPYPVYILPGLLLWDFFRRSTLQIYDDTIASQNLAQRIYVPRSAFAVAAIATYLFNWAISTLVLFAIMVFFDMPFTLALLTLPLGMALTAAFALGLGLAIATVGAFFRDAHLTYQVLLTAWLYATPIIYPLEIIAEPYRDWFALNPMLHLCRLVREPAFNGTTPDPATWLLAAAISLTTLGLGWWVFARWKHDFDYRS